MHMPNTLDSRSNIQEAITFSTQTLNKKGNKTFKKIAFKIAFKTSVW